MRAERRQELRTNELSQQLDQAMVYVKQNAALLTAVVVVAAAVVGGIFWYIKNEQSQVMAGWATLSQRNPPSDAPAPVDAYRGIAEDNLNPVLTVQAWLKVGEAAMAEMTKTAGAAPARDWSQIAADAYGKVLASAATQDVGAVGQAMIAMGVLAENKGDTAKAREWYQKVADDARFTHTPLKVQAAFRLDGMAKWSQPVVFPPPPPPPLPTTSAPATQAAPAGPFNIQSLSPIESGLLMPTTAPAGP